MQFTKKVYSDLITLADRSDTFFINYKYIDLSRDPVTKIGYDLCISATKNKKHIFVLKLLDNVTLKDTLSIARLQKFVLKTMSSFWKIRRENIIFLYLSDQLLHPVFLNILGVVDKKLKSAVKGINFMIVFFQTSTGLLCVPEYLRSKFSFLLSQLEQEVIEPHILYLKELKGELGYSREINQAYEIYRTFQEKKQNESSQKIKIDEKSAISVTNKKSKNIKATISPKEFTNKQMNILRGVLRAHKEIEIKKLSKILQLSQEDLEKLLYALLGEGSLNIAITTDGKVSLPIHKSSKRKFKDNILNGNLQDGICMICKTEIGEMEPYAHCPRCFYKAHPDYLEEWLKVNSKCPVCHEQLTREEVIVMHGSE